jgi:signal transduction histidine kinase
MLETTILVFGVLISTFTGLFVYTRNPKQIINRLYGLLTLSLVIYTIANYLSLQTDDRLFYIRTVVLASTLSVASLFFLVFFLKKQQRRITGWLKIGAYFTAIVAVLNFTPLVFSGLNEGPNPAPIPNIAASLFLMHLLVFLASSFILLIKRAGQSEGNERLQYLYLLIGISPMFLIAPYTGFIMPVVFQDVSLIFLNPIYSTFFVAMIGYAIVKHRLFDVRLIVARSLAYIFSITLLVLAYSILIYGLMLNLFDLETAYTPAMATVNILLLIFTALTFGAIKRFFDKATNKVFYRDAYDAQAFLDELNKLLVSTVDLDNLLKGSSEIIERNIKASFCSFAIRETSYFKQRVMGGKGGSFSEAEMETLKNATSKLRSKIIVADELEDRDPDLANVMKDHDVAVLVRLVTTLEYDVEGIGYIMLGLKKSGNPYTSQDLKVLEIVGNELVISTQNALRFEEIENFNITLQQKVDDATKQLRRTNEKLKLMDETKDEFISMASHQLRTPLTSVKGYLSMVLEGDAGKLSEMQTKLLDQAFVSSQRMVYLIADLLNVSRLRTGKFVIEPIPTNLADVIEGEISQLQETAKSRNLTLSYEKPENFPWLKLDETKIRQVIMNFVDNAIYYTPSGGKIEVKLADKDKSIEFTVTDNGIGIPKAEQHHMFTKFYRAANAKKARPDGTGLGLFMARKVIIAQGGSAIFQSQEGKGSTFGFSFAKDKILVPDNELPKKSDKESLKALV